MTPEDLATIRAGYLSYSGYPTPDIAALCDALEEAWTERDEQWDERLAALAESRRMLARAERAEATIREMAADALSREAQYEELERAELARDAMWEKDRAALARVRTMCDEADEITGPYSCILHTRQVRAAIEGGAE